MEQKEIKIEFAPGCFDQFEGSQEELDDLIAEIKEMFAGKTREEIEAMSQSAELLNEDEVLELFHNQPQNRNLQ